MTLPITPSLDEARAEIATRIAAAITAWNTLKGYPADGTPVEAENRSLVDLASPAASKPFLCWEMAFKGGDLASLGRDPLVRQPGQIALAVKVKCGGGTSESLKLLSHVIPYVELHLGTVIETYAAEVQEGIERQGWYFIPCLVNFKIDRIAPSPA
jgi:hypothetical protein